MIDLCHFFGCHGALKQAIVYILHGCENDKAKKEGLSVTETKNLIS